jgi:hypothetical protein
MNHDKDFLKLLQNSKEQLTDEQNFTFGKLNKQERKILLRITEDFQDWLTLESNGVLSEIATKKKQFRDIFTPYTSKSGLLTEIQNKIQEISNIPRKGKEEKFEEQLKKMNTKLKEITEKSSLEELFLLKLEIEESLLPVAEKFKWSNLVSTNTKKILEMTKKFQMSEKIQKQIQEESTNLIHWIQLQDIVSTFKISQQNRNFLQVSEIKIESELMKKNLNEIREMKSMTFQSKQEERKLKRFVEDLMEYLNEDCISLEEIENKKKEIEQISKNFEIKLTIYGTKLMKNLKSESVPNSFKQVVNIDQRYQTVKNKSNLKSKIIQNFFNDEDASQTFKIFPIFSLGNEENILETYLSPKKIESLHLNADQYDTKTNSIEFKLILTEINHNAVSIGMFNSFKGTIETIPKYDWNTFSFGKFKCALIAGPWYLEFTETSICVPKRITKKMNSLFTKISPIKILAGELFEDFSKKIAKILVEWNTLYTYKKEYPDKNQKEGNSFSFVIKILNTFFEDFKFQGVLNSFMEEIKLNGVTNSSNEMLSLNKIKIESHSMLDRMLIEMLKSEDKFRNQNLQDLIVFQAIDISYWFRSLIFGKDQFIQLHQLSKSDSPRNSKTTPMCPCFKRDLFVELFKISNLEFIDLENLPLSQNFEVSGSKKLSKKKSSFFLRPLEKNEIKNSERISDPKKKIRNFIESFRLRKDSPQNSPNSVALQETIVQIKSESNALSLKLDSISKANQLKMVEFERFKDHQINKRPYSGSFYEYILLDSNINSRYSLDSNLEKFKLSKKEKTFEIFGDKEKRKYLEKYTKDHFSFDEFNFYEMYHKYSEEFLKERKLVYQRILLEDFINENGKQAIYFSEKKLKRLKLLSIQNPEKAIFLAYQQVYDTLDSVIIQFKESNYEKLIEKSSSFPKNFKELKNQLDEFKIFSSFVSVCYGQEFIDCWLLLTEYSKNPSKEILNELMNLSKIVIKNPVIRIQIYKKDKPQIGWFDVYFKHIDNILSHEYYPRFIHSRIWKNYIQSNFKNLKFENLYVIEEIEKEISILSEKSQYILVKNCLTNESFKGKRIISNSNLLKQQARDVIFNLY